MPQVVRAFCCPSAHLPSCGPPAHRSTHWPCCEDHARKWLLVTPRGAREPATIAIVGVGETEYSRRSGRTEWELANEAIAAALGDAGIDPLDVDGLVHSTYENVDDAMVLRTFGMTLNYYSQV